MEYVGNGAVICVYPHRLVAIVNVTCQCELVSNTLRIGDIFIEILIDYIIVVYCETVNSVFVDVTVMAKCNLLGFI